MDTLWCILSFAPSVFIYMYLGNIGISIISSIFALIISFCFCHSLAKRFNKGIGYVIGLFLLNPIFVAIITLIRNVIIIKVGKRIKSGASMNLILVKKYMKK